MYVLVDDFREDYYVEKTALLMLVNGLSQPPGI
jgi:hypothetical protein